MDILCSSRIKVDDKRSSGRSTSLCNSFQEEGKGVWFSIQEVRKGSFSSTQRKRDLSKIQCYGCQGFGQFKGDCPKMANNNKRKGKQHASTTDIEDENLKKVKGDMTRERGNISSMMEKRMAQRVELGYNHSYVVKGVGKASIEMESGNNVHLSNVLYIPGLKKNLVPISCLEDKGDRVAFVYGKVLVWSKVSSIDDARVIGIHDGKLYRLISQSNQALVHDEINPSCALGKNIKKPFLNSDNIAKETLDLIHSDVCGPMLAKLLVGLFYFVTFVDDFSHKTWIYLLNSKDEVFDKFQEVKAEVENLIGKKIKILRSDNGGEYTLKELVAFCKKHGIKRELIVPYNPQRNGVAE
eukprot:PITA_09654